jgi:twitching motility protein PilT
MQTARGAGMQTMNDALLELVRGKQVLPKDALSKAVHKADLRQSLERAGFRPDQDAEPA